MDHVSLLDHGTLWKPLMVSCKSKCVINTHSWTDGIIDCSFLIWHPILACFGISLLRSLIIFGHSSLSCSNYMLLSLLDHFAFVSGKSGLWLVRSMDVLLNHITCSFRNHPLLVVTVLTGILAVFKSYPSIGDAALFLSLVPLHDELFKCKSNYIKGVPVL